jgi:signal transduction histidine kinase/DNA-binding response OmpR family regulator/HPt (histidine-containing phosphotransfer) domain-containing protein
MQLVFMVTAFIGGGGIIAMIAMTPPPATYSYYAGLILVFMFLYTFGRIRFIWATVSGWMLVILYEVSAIYFTSPPLPVLINNNFFFIGANIVGMASCYLLEFFDRKNFFIQGQLENEKEKTKKTNEDLERRVLERTALLNNLNASLKAEIERRKQFESELTNIKKELEIRVENRTLELKKANRELEKAKEIADASARSKSEFLANMSHEIRTPMNAIIGMSDLAMNQGINQAQRNEYLGIIGKSARSLLGIINDILDLSKIEAGKLDFEIKSFKLREYVEGVTDMFIETIHSKGVEFIVDIAPDIPVYVKGDSLRLQQVLLNLISNALKFTEKGEICVRVKKGMISDLSVELLFEVVDTGIGIDLYKNYNLFDAFAQADGSITRKYGGTGLGLTICKRIVTMMGGDIDVESVPGQGSTFRFNVFLERDDERETRSTVLSINKRIRETGIIAVINNRNLQGVVSKMLDVFGMKSVVTDDFKAAADLIERQVSRKTSGRMCDILILDEDVLNEDRLRVIKDLKSVRNGEAPLPVILLGSLKKEDEETALKSWGIDEIIMKPLKSSNMLDAIMKAAHGVTPMEIAREDDGGPEAGLRGMDVLLVEDNPINQMVAIELLLLEGVHVSQASNGIEAIELIRNNRFDAVLMDVQMPEMDGIEATRVIRNELEIGHEDLPIVAMTAHVMQGDRERCLEAGMDDFISKPIERQKLFKVLGKYSKGEKGPREVFLVERNPGRTGPDLPERLPGLDVAGSLKRLGCGSEHYVFFLKQTCQFLEDNIGSLKPNRHEMGKKELMNILHSMKGSSANISAENIHKIVIRYENALRASGECDRERLVFELDNAFVELQKACGILQEYVLTSPVV